MSNEKHYSNNPVADWVENIAIPEHRALVKRIQQQFGVLTLHDWAKTVDGRLDGELSIALMYTALNTPLTTLSAIAKGIADIRFITTRPGETWLSEFIICYKLDISSDPKLMDVVIDTYLSFVSGYQQPFRFSNDVDNALLVVDRPLCEFTTDELIKELKYRVCKDIDPELLELNFNIRVNLEK